MKYRVKALEVHAVYIEVEAEDEQDAQSKAEEILSVGCYDDGTDVPVATYSHTLERYEWPVDPA